MLLLVFLFVLGVRKDWMSEKVLMKGNEALGEAAILAGCQAYFGYPITPQTELLEYMARRMPELGRTFIQAESELSAINMAYGAASTGIRTMTSTSSPGFSLMQETISYMAGARLPCVIVNVMRGGPGLGNIQPSQGDYNQMTKGGGHGDYSLITLAPASVQEIVDLVPVAFDLAEKYRFPVLLALDGLLGQMMEPVVLPEPTPAREEPFSWALTGTGTRNKNVISSRDKNTVTSLQLNAKGLEEMNLDLQKTISASQNREERSEVFLMEDATIVVVAYGSVARIVKTAVKLARRKGIRTGLFRVVSLNPFPEYRLYAYVSSGMEVLVVEMNSGQMLNDVRTVLDNRGIEFFGRVGGQVPSVEEILAEIEKIWQDLKV